MIRRLLLHPRIDLTHVSSVEHVGEGLGSVHRNLSGLTNLRFESVDLEEVGGEVDVALLGLPHDVSLDVVPRLVASGTRVLDMSAAFRLRSAAEYGERYGRPHPHPELLERFVYGLPEIHRNHLRDARGIAGPGCFATCVELSLLPLARAGWLKGEVSVTAMTGSSGSGAQPKLTTHHPVRSVNLRPYAPLRHVQAYEIEQELRSAGADDLVFDFVPVSVPLSRGILTVTHLTLPASVTQDALTAHFIEFYRDEPFVRVPEDREPEVAAVSGSQYVEVGVRVGPERGEVRSAVCFGALDNLVKGGAGQLIQCLNIMFGFDETTTLADPGSWP